LNNNQENQTPKVAVLFAAYNGIDWIQEQVDSILSQKGVQISIFISVDLSSDGTYDWCKSLERNEQSVKVLQYGNYYGGAAKNFFRLINDVNIKEYEFIAFSDQDDIWLSNKIEYAIKEINDRNIDAFSSDVIAFWENGKEIYIKKSWSQKKFDHFFESAGPGCTYVIKSTALEVFKSFMIENWQSVNEIDLHDWVIYAHLRSQNYKWHIDKRPLIKYRQHKKNVLGSNIGLHAYFKRILLIRESWYQKEVKKIQNLLASEINFNLKFRIKNFLQLRRRLRDAIILLIISILGLY